MNKGFPLSTKFVSTFDFFSDWVGVDETDLASMLQHDLLITVFVGL